MGCHKLHIANCSELKISFRNKTLTSAKSEKKARSYYPFGMPMQHIQLADGQRFGFNGKEKDTEGMGGGGSTLDYGFRIYNPQICKFLSVDPLVASYPWYTPYQFAGNKPIWATDLDGLEEFFTNQGMQSSHYGPISSEKRAELGIYTEDEVRSQISELRAQVVKIKTVTFTDDSGKTQSYVNPFCTACNDLEKRANQIETNLNGIVGNSVSNTSDKKGSFNSRTWNSDKYFQETFLPTLLKHEGGYQDKASDNGNYVDGELIGTNHGISAPVLKEFLGKKPTVNDMKDLTVGVAGLIYKKNYWDKPKVGQINDKYVALQFADMYVNSGGNAVKIMQRAVNSLGANVKVDGAIGKKTIDAINASDPVKLHEAYKQERIKFYENLYDKNPTKYGEWIKGWKNRANSFKYGDK